MKFKGRMSDYWKLHRWIASKYGKAIHCENDPTHKGRFEWANISGEYRQDISDYKQLCKSCHTRMDRGNKCLKGHELTVENSYPRKSGGRMCKVCMIMRWRKYKEGNSEYISSWMKAYRQRNRQKIKKRQREWRAENIDRLKLYDKERRSKEKLLHRKT